jgi:accessory gene regulator protein AgrB
MYVHHLLAIVTFLFTLHFLNFTLVFGVMLLFIEISTPYVSIRWLLYTHDYGHSLAATIDSLLIFIAFLLGRLFFSLYIVAGYGLPYLLHFF